METRGMATPDAMPLERLEAEITELAGHLAAAECRWLLLVAEYDRRAGYEEWGRRSCAHWLSAYCGLDMRAAREKVRVGRALEDLPAIADAFAAGNLSYSKVRALTRVATPANEADLVMLAGHATAVQVEHIVRSYRGVLTAEEEVEVANERHVTRFVRFDWDDDGSLVIHGRMPAELGAIVMEAFDAARGQVADDVLVENGPAGPSSEVAPPAFAATNADALVMMAETLLASGPAARTGGDRFQIVLNGEVNVLTDDAPGGVCQLDHGPVLAPETLRRLACDASVVFVLRDEHGNPIDISRKTRTIPPSTRRAVRARDEGCRFPDCGERFFIDVHHVRHWARGGTHELTNLLELCWFHHRLVHEGGWGVRLDAEGVVVAIQPNGNVLPRCRRSGVAVSDGAASDGRIECHNRARGIAIDHTTNVPRLYGDPLDLDHVTTALRCVDQR